MNYQNQQLRETQRYSFKSDGHKPLSAHFKAHEFACHDNSDTILIHPALVLLLEDIRTHFGKPVSIISGYRTPSYNRRVGGAPNSQHVKGMAADIIVSEVLPKDVADYAESLEAGGVGRYPGRPNEWVHVDVMGRGRRWVG